MYTWLGITDAWRLFENHLAHCLLSFTKLQKHTLSSVLYFYFLDLYLCELSEHRLLLTEGREGDASDNPDRHLQLQQLQQQTHSQGLRSDQGLLRQGEDGLLAQSASWSGQQWADHFKRGWKVFNCTFNIFVHILRFWSCSPHLRCFAGRWEEASWWGEEAAQEEDER